MSTDWTQIGPRHHPGLAADRRRWGNLAPHLAKLVHDERGGDDARRLRAQDARAERDRDAASLSCERRLLLPEAALRPDEQRHRLRNKLQPPQVRAQAPRALALPGEEPQDRCR